MHSIGDVEQFIGELEARGLIHGVTSREKLISNLANGRKTYLGIDPTASSLHLGNYLALVLLRRFLNHGFPVVILLGGMTALIGDPSFRSGDRPEMGDEELSRNLASIELEVRKFLPTAEVINNYCRFYENLSIVSLLRDMCKFINVSELLNKEFLSMRLNRGLTLSEFMYPLFQSWDFYSLYVSDDVYIQVGGSDQWGNMVTGLELIGRKITSGHDAVCMTFPLLLDGSGRKFGKSEGNPLFLNRNLTSPYSVYQYLINLGDEESLDYLRKLTLLPLPRIMVLQELHLRDKSARVLQRQLALTICDDLYGSDTSARVKAISEKLFCGKLDLSEEDFSLIKYSIPTSRYVKGMKLAQALIDLKFSNSIAESRRLINSGCVFLFDHPLGLKDTLNLDNSRHGYWLLRKGRKNYGLVYAKDIS